MKLAFQRKSLNEKIDDLRHRNQAFLALSEQIIRYNAYSWNPVQTQWDEKSTDKTLEKIQRVQDASQTLFSGFERLWSCSQHEDHSANIRLCLSTTELFTDPGSKLSFDITLTTWDVGSDTPNAEYPIQLAIESILEEPTQLIGKRPAVQFADILAPQSQQADPVTTNITRQSSIPVQKESRRSRLKRALDVLKGKDTVDTGHRQNVLTGEALADSPTIPHSKSEVKKNSVPSLPDLGSVTDLCSRLDAPPEATNARNRSSIGYFKGSEATKYIVYNTPLSSPDFRGAVTLSHIISDRQRGRRLSNTNKWRLAGSLAMATLLYHSTPWLHPAWRSDDVLFFNFGTSSSSNTLESPHLHPGTAKRHGKQDTAKKSWTKNELIYRLGIMLLELEFEDNVSNLIEKSMSDGTPPIEMFRAESLVLLKRRAGEHLGTLYGRIVRMCLDCDFGLGLEEYGFERGDVKRVFYESVVLRFQERMPEYQKIWED